MTSTYKPLEPITNTKLCKNTLSSPVLLSRDSATPIYDRNQLELNLSNTITNVKLSIDAGKGISKKNVIVFSFNGGSLSFSDKEYRVKRMFLFTPSFHKLSNSLAGPLAPIEIMIQCEATVGNGDPDYLNISVFGKSGETFGRSGSFMNQLLGAVHLKGSAAGASTTTAPSTTGAATGAAQSKVGLEHFPVMTFTNSLNLYDILPKNRSYFNYSGCNPEGKCFSKNNVQWIVFENSINIGVSDLKKITKVYKAAAPHAPLLKIMEAENGQSQYVYYKSDRDATLAGIESGDVKYVKCSRKIMNEDPDAYRKHLYNRKQKNRQCDQIFDINKKLEKDFESQLEKRVGDRSLLGFLSNNFDKYNDKIMNFILMLFVFVLLFIAAYSIVFGVATTIKKFKTDGFKNTIQSAGIDAD
jgi:hypothetical protein